MKDVMHQNYPVVTGGTAIAGMLTDGNGALRLSSSGVWDVADSASSSLAVADGAQGGATMTGWFSVPSLPGSTQTILGKVGSYELKLTSAGKLQWILTNGANSVTVTSNRTIQTDTQYHFAGVYNGDFTGTPIFGNQVQGSSQFTLFGDYYQGNPTGSTNNLQVCKYTVLEKGQITSLVADLQRIHDATSFMNFAAVVYKDSGGLPGELLVQSTHQALDPTNYVSRAWVSFPAVCAVYPGDYWLGLVAGAEQGQFKIGYETSGGTRKWRAATVTDSPDNYFGELEAVPDPFGTPVSGDAGKFSIYANYTPTGRTGAEGRALIYLNGLEDSSLAYTNGIADTANNLQHPAGLAVDLDDWAILNKKLTQVQVAMLYNAR